MHVVNPAVARGGSGGLRIDVCRSSSFAVVFGRDSADTIPPLGFPSA